MKKILPILVFTSMFLLSIGCDKVDRIRPRKPGSEYTAMIGGTRIWHFKSRYTSQWQGVYVQKDTSYLDTFGIQIVNDTMIDFRGRQMIFSKFDSAHSTLVFGNKLYFNYSNNSIFYQFAAFEHLYENLFVTYSTP